MVLFGLRGPRIVVAVDVMRLFPVLQKAGIIDDCSADWDRGDWTTRPVQCCPWSAQHSDLEYQKRAGRYEGIKPKPVAGYDIECSSVPTLQSRTDARQTQSQVLSRLAV